jgi:serine/threonine protein phosphatase PrpC
VKGTRSKEWNIQPIVGFEIEQKPGRGEDASVCIADPKNRTALIACLDGCGGSGAKVYPEAENWTGARIASFSSGRVLATWYDRNDLARLGLQDYPAERVAQSLTQALRENIDKTKSEVSPGPDRMIVSSMIRPFPTTLACAVVSEESDGLRCLYLWAGDSRGFLLTQQGLTQTTTDDLKEALDPFENIERDGVLSNVISAKPFHVNVREAAIHEPCLILTATDGCFSYFRTPMDFEYTLLRTLYDAKSPAEWREMLISQIGQVASDDYTLEMLSFGFDTFDEIKAYFLPTLRSFYTRYGKRIAESKSRDELRAIWDAYKGFYLRTQL